MANDGIVTIGTQLDDSGFIEGMKKLEETAGQSTTSIEKQQEKITETAKAQAEGMAKAFEDSFGKIGEISKSAIEQLGFQLEKINANTQNALPSLGLNNFFGSGENLALNINLQSIVDAVAQLESLMSYLNNISQQEIVNGEQLTACLQSALEIYDLMHSTATSLLETSRENAQELLLIEAEKLAMHLQMLEEYKASYLEQIDGYTQAGLEAAQRSAEESFLAYQAVGLNIVDGITLGINLNKHKAIGAIEEMAQQMQTAMAKINRSASPSKAYRDLAKDQTDGIALGIELNRKKPIDEMQKLGMEMQSAFYMQPQANSTYNINNSKNITQVFNSATAPSQFEVYRKAVQNV